MNRKNRFFKMRMSEVLFRKLVAISKATGKTKTAIIEDLLSAEYDNNKKYEKWYYADLDRRV